MTALLEVERVSVRYEAAGGALGRMVGRRPVDAVLDASFALPQGGTLALIGESGSGKSTLARAVMGLTPYQAGAVRFLGRAPEGRGDAAFRPWRRRIGMMFQDPVASLSPRLTVRALLAEPFRIHGRDGSADGRDAGAACERLLALVGLPADFAARYPHQLSGGQARRVALARALALSPLLLIADEPTAGLDVSVQGEILNLLARIRAGSGLAALIITHNLAVVPHVSERVAVMYMGQLVEQGPTRAVLARPAHPYTDGLLAAQPRPDPDQRRPGVTLEGEVPSLARRPPGCAFHTRCPRAAPRCRVEPPAERALAGRLLRCHYPLIEAGAEERPA
ncbi:MAG TPA: ABC transporter ATP-binding protein [Acetobacteraceae bacterium]|nr:ABC transporter ATP-binding protein [Acetobacteraceae bacterium]